MIHTKVIQLVVVIRSALITCFDISEEQYRRKGVQRKIMDPVAWIYLVLIAVVAVGIYVLIKYRLKKVDSEYGEKTESKGSKRRGKKTAIDETELYEYLNSLPELDETGLPVQTNITIPEDSGNNTLYISEADALTEQRKFEEAIQLYIKAGENGSVKGRLMAIVLSTIPGMCFTIHGDKTDMISNWMADTERDASAVFGKGSAVAEILVEHERRRKPTPRLLRYLQESAALVFPQTMKAGDPLTHCLLYNIFDGQVKTFLPDIYKEDLEKMFCISKHITRFGEQFFTTDEKGNIPMFREGVPMIFRDKSPYVEGMLEVAMQLDDMKMYKSALACYRKCYEVGKDAIQNSGIMQVACYRIAHYYMQGSGVSQDLEKAEQYIKEAASFAVEITPEDSLISVAEELIEANKKLAADGKKVAFDPESFMAELQRLVKESYEKVLKYKEEQKQSLVEKVENAPTLHGKIVEVSNNSFYFITYDKYFYKLDCSLDDTGTYVIDRGYIFGKEYYKLSEEQA